MRKRKKKWEIQHGIQSETLSQTCTMISWYQRSQKTTNQLKKFKINPVITKNKWNIHIKKWSKTKKLGISEQMKSISTSWTIIKAESITHLACHLRGLTNLQHWMKNSLILTANLTQIPLLLTWIRSHGEVKAAKEKIN